MRVCGSEQGQGTRAWSPRVWPWETLLVGAGLGRAVTSVSRSWGRPCVCILPPVLLLLLLFAFSLGHGRISRQ